MTVRVRIPLVTPEKRNNTKLPRALCRHYLGIRYVSYGPLEHQLIRPPLQRKYRGQHSDGLLEAGPVQRVTVGGRVVQRPERPRRFLLDFSVRL